MTGIRWAGSGCCQGWATRAHGGEGAGQAGAGRDERAGGRRRRRRRADGGAQERSGPVRRRRSGDGHPPWARPRCPRCPRSPAAVSPGPGRRLQTPGSRRRPQLRARVPRAFGVSPDFDSQRARKFRETPFAHESVFAKAKLRRAGETFPRAPPFP